VDAFNLYKLRRRIKIVGLEQLIRKIQPKLIWDKDRKLNTRRTFSLILEAQSPRHVALKLTMMVLSSIFIAIVHLAHLIAANVIRDPHGLEYASLEAQRDNLPLLQLPYGSWQASRYDVDSDVCGIRLFQLSISMPNMLITDLHV
jgi:hypothetical protein